MPGIFILLTGMGKSCEPEAFSTEGKGRVELLFEDFIGFVERHLQRLPASVTDGKLFARTDEDDFDLVGRGVEGDGGGTRGELEEAAKHRGLALPNVPLEPFLHHRSRVIEDEQVNDTLGLNFLDAAGEYTEFTRLEPLLDDLNNTPNYVEAEDAVESFQERLNGLLETLADLEISNAVEILHHIAAVHLAGGSVLLELHLLTVLEQSKVKQHILEFTVFGLQQMFVPVEFFSAHEILEISEFDGLSIERLHKRVRKIDSNEVVIEYRACQELSKCLHVNILLLVLE